MAITYKEMHRGAAFTRIVEYPGFKAINEVDHEYGHYVVNADRAIFLRHSLKAESPWVFSFEPGYVQAIMEAVDNPKTKVFLVLVCDKDTICLIDEDQIEALFLIASRRTQSISVRHTPGQALRVRRTKTRVPPIIIPHITFPRRIFK